MKRIIGLVAAALTLGGCVLYAEPVPPVVYGPRAPGVYVAPPPVVIAPGRPWWGGWGRGRWDGGWRRSGWEH